MTSRKIIVTLLLLLCWSSAGAQFFKSVDEWLRQRQARQPYDTTFIYRPQERWLVRERSVLSSHDVGLVAGEGGDMSSIRLNSGLLFRQSFGVGYRNINLGFGFSPFSQKQSFDFDLSTYGNRLSFNGYLSVVAGRNGTMSANGTTVELPSSSMAATHGVLELTYAFNGRRFSMPAARCQSYVQRRSAGSLLALAGAQFYGAVAAEPYASELPVREALTSLVGLGLGYGYNWVPSGHWLIHLCLTETVGFLNSSRLTLGDREVAFTEKTPVFATTGTLTVCYYFKKFYVGASSRFENLMHLAIGDADFFNGMTARQAVISAGIRF